MPPGLELEIHLEFSHTVNDNTSDATRHVAQDSLAAEKVGGFVGRGFSHDVSALNSSGVLTPEARKSHLSAAWTARVGLSSRLTQARRAERPMPRT